MQKTELSLLVLVLTLVVSCGDRAALVIDDGWVIAPPSGTQEGTDVAVTQEGEVYLTGDFSGQMSLGEATVSSAGAWDVFVARVSRQGKVRWLRSAGGLVGDTARGIAVDREGNAFVVGTFAAGGIGPFVASFGGHAVTVPRYGVVCYLAKLSPDGETLWLRTTEGASSYCEVHDVAVDQGGNAILIGTYQTEVRFASTTLQSRSNSDMYLAKYSSSGQLLWAISSQEQPEEWTTGGSVTVDPAGTIYIVGTSHQLTLGRFTLAASTRRGLFVARVSPSGEVVWATSDAKDGTASLPADLVVDRAGNLYVRGHAGPQQVLGVSFGDGSERYPSPFLAKLGTEGRVLWAEALYRRPAGNSYGFEGQSTKGGGMAIAANGHLVLGGTFRGQVTFGGVDLQSDGHCPPVERDKGDSPLPFPCDQVFLAVLDADGVPRAAIGAGGPQIDEGNAVALDGEGNAYLTGAFVPPATFGANIEVTGASETQRAFLWKVQVQP